MYFFMLILKQKVTLNFLEHYLFACGYAYQVGPHLFIGTRELMKKKNIGTQDIQIECHDQILKTIPDTNNKQLLAMHVFG